MIYFKKDKKKIDKYIKNKKNIKIRSQRFKEY